jgi:uncharacterized protein with HEPN domain
VRSDHEGLLDVLEAIERIELQAARGRAAFDEDELAQAAVIRWIEIIGEATRGLSVAVRAASAPRAAAPVAHRPLPPCLEPTG